MEDDEQHLQLHELQRTVLLTQTGEQDGLKGIKGTDDGKAGYVFRCAA